jgi:hypothetical protein
MNEKPIQPDEIDGFDFTTMLQRNVPMIEIVPYNDNENAEVIIGTITIQGYKRVASWRNTAGGLVLLFEKGDYSGKRN